MKALIILSLITITSISIQGCTNFNSSFLIKKKRENFKVHYSRIEFVKGFKESIINSELTNELLASFKSGVKNNIGYSAEYYDRCFKIYENDLLNKYYIHCICDHTLIEFNSKELLIERIKEIKVRNINSQ